MHNSLYIRDLLRRTNADAMRVERRDPHRAVALDPEACPSEGEFRVAGTWQIRHDDRNGFAEAAGDLYCFFSQMGIACGGLSANVAHLVHVTDLEPRAFRLRLDPGHIRVEACDGAGLWAGLAWLEWEMRTRRGPFLPKAEIVGHARWATQISQGPWGGNYSVPDFSPEYLSDDAFRLYAHYGVNSMMIYGDLLCYVRSKVFPELNCEDYARNVAGLKDAARRALSYGVRFSYVVVGPKLRAGHPLFQRCPDARGSGTQLRLGPETIHCLCSSDEECLAFYAETFDNLFCAVPELAGLILIIGGESFYHCHTWAHAAVRCERCYARKAEDVVADLARVTADAVARGQLAGERAPDAYVVAWPYNTDAWDRPGCLALIDALPPNVGFYDQIDRKQLYRKEGYAKLIWDYSVDFIGPSDSIVARAKRVKRRGLPLFLKTETGIGLEVFQYPYVPAIQRLADKWQVVRDLRPQGVLQSWLFYGMFGSRAEELGLWAAYDRDLSRDDFLRAMAVRDFGPQAADPVLQSWGLMSRAVGHIPCITLRTYYVGPSFLGPCHPLVPEKDAEIPDVFCGVLYYLQEGEETFSRARTQVKTSLVMDALPPTAQDVGVYWEGSGDGWDIVLSEYRTAAAYAEEAWQTLLKARDLTRTANDARNLGEESLLTELVYRTFLSCANAVAYLAARRRLEESSAPRFAESMARVAADEEKNALAAVHIYENAPWLDLAERTDGVFSPCVAMIEEKVSWIRRSHNT